MNAPASQGAGDPPVLDPPEPVAEGPGAADPAAPTGPPPVSLPLLFGRRSALPAVECRVDPRDIGFGTVHLVQQLGDALVPVFGQVGANRSLEQQAAGDVQALGKRF